MKIAEGILLALALLGVPFLVGEGIGEQRVPPPHCRAQLPDGRALIIETRGAELTRCIYQQPGRKRT